MTNSQNTYDNVTTYLKTKNREGLIRTQRPFPPPLISHARTGSGFSQFVIKPICYVTGMLCYTHQQAVLK